MIRCVICSLCGAKVQYDDRSVCEGSREKEDVDCPKCGNLLCRVYTDLIPIAWIAEEGEEHTAK